MQHDQERSLRNALIGAKVLLIGGDPRPAAIQRIKTELKLDAITHRPTRKSDPSTKRFLSDLKTQAYGLVVCARGLTRTQHGRNLHAECRKLGLPLLDCFHLPHPNALIAGVMSARLSVPVMRRCEELKRVGTCFRGGDS